MSVTEREKDFLVMAGYAAFILAVLIGYFGFIYRPMTAEEYQTVFEVLPVCATEDSDNCKWDASEQGNGEGRDFVNWGGHTVYGDTFK